MVPGDVTEIVMLPEAPEFVPAVKVTPSVSAAGLFRSGPPPDRQPIVQVVCPLTVPMPESAATVTVVPAAIGLPLVSCTLNVNEVALVAPPLTLWGMDIEDTLEVMDAPDVDMISRCDAPIARVEVLQLDPGVLPVHVIPTN